MRGHFPVDKLVLRWLAPSRKISLTSIAYKSDRTTSDERRLCPVVYLHFRAIPRLAYLVFIISQRLYRRHIKIDPLGYEKKTSAKEVTLCRIADSKISLIHCVINTI